MKKIINVANKNNYDDENIVADDYAIKDCLLNYDLILSLFCWLYPSPTSAASDDVYFPSLETFNSSPSPAISKQTKKQKETFAARNYLIDARLRPSWALKIG